MLMLARNLPILPPDVLVYIHSGVGSAQEAIFGRTILWVEGNTDTCRTMEDITLRGKWRVKRALEPMRYFFDFRARANLWK